ncbi:hypothetical protein AYK25_07855 [Thermoplasmatales archaeon SM1-50]|nr:MAG: hypothetical protein AYK25_07855 [Thermoplasmatales archaeon SM1-50]
MKKTGAVILLAFMSVLALYPSVNASDTGVVVDQQIVTISLTGTDMQVDETFKLTNTNKENQSVTSLRFWIQQNNQGVVRVTEKFTGIELVPLITGNIQTCNLSTVNLTIAPEASLTIQLTYNLPIDEQYFIKTLLYNTTFFSVTYEDRDLFKGEYLLYGSDINNAIRIRLYQPTEAPLSITMIIIIFIVVIISLAALLFLLKKQRRKTKKTGVESEETLTTKKILLLSLLKDLEKQYRAQSISNETYTKIKDEYKQQAVDVMKKLDALKK